MAKNTKKTMSIANLVVDYGTNVRVVGNYDIPAMMEAIVATGRITDPIHVRLADNVVLRGNRRTLAGQKLLADPTTPQDVAEALKKVDVVAHDVQAGSAEELDIILDHGNTKGLSRTEILLTVWRMDKQFLSEAQIIGMLYQPLAGYTGNQQKAVQAAAMSNLKERSDFLRKWLHGTVGNYFLAAAKMGRYVREQMELSHLMEDRQLPAEKKVEMKVNRDRITQLSAAKSKDDPTKGGKGWDVEKGGENFNLLIQQFKDEDAGIATTEKKTRPNVKDLEDRAAVFSHPAIRSALLVAAGHAEHGKALVDLDATLNRMTMVLDILAAFSVKVMDPRVGHLLKTIIGQGPAADVEEALKPFVGA